MALAGDNGWVEFSQETIRQEKKKPSVAARVFVRRHVYSRSCLVSPFDISWIWRVFMFEFAFVHHRLLYYYS